MVNVTNMEKLIGFFNSNIKTMKDIYLKHRLEEGNGILSLFLQKDENDNEEVKVGYMKYDILPHEMQVDLDNRIKNNTSDIIYFYLNSIDSANIVETDIRDIE
jgi:hypothetical protein